MSDEQKSEEKEMTQSSSSSSADIRDWEFVDSDLLVKASLKDSVTSEDDSIENTSGPNVSPSGLFVHDLPAKHSGLEELIAENDKLRCSESNSSSDIDIIDDNIEDVPDILENPSMDISFCSSEFSTTITEERNPTPVEEISSINEDVLEQIAPPSDRSLVDESSTYNSFLAAVRWIIGVVIENLLPSRSSIGRDNFAIGLTISICVLLSGCQYMVNKACVNEAALQQMKGDMQKLQTENEHLKSKVLAKIESGKIFGELDEEVKDLRSENFKLHKAMQKVIYQLEEQTNAIKQGIEVKDNYLKDPYRKEITKLKEQINLLRIDNEELQKQLVRIRYGKYNNHQENNEYKYEGENSKSKNRVSKSYEDKKENFENKYDGKEEVQELRQKLDKEVQKLQAWKESLEELVKQIEKSQGKGEYMKKKQSECDNKDCYGKAEDDKHKYKKHKNRRFYNWSWKAIKNNFKGTLENFPDVSNMISKYVLFDKKKVDGALDTISHYYNKAHEKTMKILESYSVDEKTQNVKDEIWTLMGEMKNKWIEMKNEFLEKNFGNKVADNEIVEEDVNIAEPIEEEEEGSLPEKPQIFYDYADKESKLADSEYDVPTEELKESDLPALENDYYSLDDNQEWRENVWNIKEVNDLLKEAHRRFSYQESNLNSWIFERAQHRADLRENEGADLNWYLRRNKQSEDSESGYASESEDYGEYIQHDRKEE